LNVIFLSPFDSFEDNAQDKYAQGKLFSEMGESNRVEGVACRV
jgi:hypothetical protein